MNTRRRWLFPILTLVLLQGSIGYSSVFDMDSAMAVSIKSRCGSVYCRLMIDGESFGQAVLKAADEAHLNITARVDRRKYGMILNKLMNGELLTEIIDEYGQKQSTGNYIFDRDPSTRNIISAKLKFQWADSNSPTARLWDWLHAQPNNSVTPLLLIVKGLEFAQGEMMEALVACYDVLAIGHNNDNYRNHFTKTLKLIDIRGDRVTLDKVEPSYPRLSNWSPAGDNFSAWYHFFGSMLYTYFRTAGSYFLIPFGKATSTAVIGIEHTLFTDWHGFTYLYWVHRREIDMAAVDAGYEIALALKNDQLKDSLIKKSSSEYIFLKTVQ